MSSAMMNKSALAGSTSERRPGGADQQDAVRAAAGRVDWEAFAYNMPLSKDADSVARRKRFFDVCDINGNGLISLAEYDRGLRTFLGANTLSNQLFSAKPAIARAFHAARRADNKAGGGANGAPNLTRVRGSEMVSHVDADDYVSRSEFRTLLAYTRQFFELWIMFLAVDSGGANVITEAQSSGDNAGLGAASLGDKRISLDEFCAAVPQIETWGSTNGRPPLIISDPAGEFAAIDADGSGYLRFDEFASWALSKKLDLEDDDDPDNVEALLTADPAHLKVTDGIEIFRNELRQRRADAAYRAKTGFHDVYASRTLVAPTSKSGPPPASPRAVRSVMRSELSQSSSARGSAASVRERREAARTLGQYTAQYRARLLNDMYEMQRRPPGAIAGGIPLIDVTYARTNQRNADRLGIAQIISRYDSERLLSKLEAGAGRPYASLVPAPLHTGGVPALPPPALMAPPWSARPSAYGAGVTDHSTLQESTVGLPNGLTNIESSMGLYSQHLPVLGAGSMLGGEDGTTAAAGARGGADAPFLQSSSTSTWQPTPVPYGGTGTPLAPDAPPELYRLSTATVTTTALTTGGSSSARALEQALGTSPYGSMTSSIAAMQRGRPTALHTSMATPLPPTTEAPTPEARMARRRAVAKAAHEALQRSQPEWVRTSGLNPPGRAGVEQHWLMSDVMPRKGAAAPGGAAASSSSSSSAAPPAPVIEWPQPLPPAVRPRTVVLDALSRLDPLTVSTSRLRYTPSATLGASAHEVNMVHEPSKDRF